MSEIISDGKVVGQKTGAKITKRWVPKEWRTEYEAMVALSCTGLSNEEVGKRFGYGKQQVSNILNTPQGKKLQEIILARLRRSNEESFAERIASLQDVALTNVETVLKDEELLQRSPLAIFDRSQKFLVSSATKGFKSDSPQAPQTVQNINNSKNIIINGVTRDSLAEAMEKSDEAKELASGLIRTTATPVNGTSQKELGGGRETVRTSNDGGVETSKKAS